MVFIPSVEFFTSLFEELDRKSEHTIELTHRAKNRSGFALGALSAAKWVAGKKGMYDFSEVFEDVG